MMRKPWLQRRALVSLGLLVLVTVIIKFVAMPLFPSSDSLNQESRNEAREIKSDSGAFQDIRIQPDTSSPGKCRTIRWGRDYSVDSAGFICLHELVQPTGCCIAEKLLHSKIRIQLVKESQEEERALAPTLPEASIESDETPNLVESMARSMLLGPYSCDTCSPQYHCCEKYEPCVTCCLNQTLATIFGDVINEQRDSQSSSLPHQQLYREDIKDKFDLCSLKCKTSSRSVVHQNSFRSPLKNCYGPKDPPLLGGTARDVLQDGSDNDEVT